MSNLNNKILEEIKTAMKAKDQERLSVLRMLNAALKNKKIELGNKEELGEEDAVAVLKSEIKKRKDSIESYKAGNRQDLVDKEEAEIKVLEEFMPEQMSEDDVRAVVQVVVDELKPNGPQDFGKVMGASMAKLKNQADGQVVSKAVKELLK